MTGTPTAPRPFATTLIPATGSILPGGTDNVRRLSGLADLFADPARARAMATGDDVVVSADPRQASPK